MLRITRREWAAALGASVAAVNPAPAQQTGGDLFEEAKGGLKKTLDALRQYKLEPAVEPAHVFKP